ncbi:helix-turn-helix domain-containing protein [Fundidesulfovibrio agrisoli]|uniref:helix-turn-helix domain-containing protein n=1 Tax=Fundidesulfovibrio agrisoli TaxID=2922717 RepID=UPI001FAB6D29|nr:helix-turn-helix domain-containing protein [Fundidesulfovibrio agrisoli]
MNSAPQKQQNPGCNRGNAENRKGEVSTPSMQDHPQGVKHNNVSLMQAIMANNDLTPSEKWVAACLIWHRNSVTGLCNPSGKVVASETGLSLRTVRTALAGLEEKGVVTHRRTNSSARWFFNGLSATVALPKCDNCTSEGPGNAHRKSPFREELKTLEQAKAYGARREALTREEAARIAEALEVEHAEA